MSAVTPHPLLRIFLPFAFGYYLSYFLRTVNAVISPTLSAELGLSASALGLLTSTYFFAFALAQIPVGLALDRFGPRRTEAALMLLTAAGCGLFALGQDMLSLALARGLIGLGVAANLMAAFKAFALWFPRERQAALTGLIMTAGALGALTSTTPLEWLMPVLGWRGAFVALALASLLAACILWRCLPEPAVSTAHLAPAGLLDVFRRREFWLFSVYAFFFTGGFLAIQGLWAMHWLLQVDGLDRAAAARHLLGLNLGMLIGQMSIASLASRFARRGMTQLGLLRAGIALALMLQVMILCRLGSPLLLWTLLGFSTAAGTQMYGAVAAHYPLSLSGRATSALNLIVFLGAFAIQWGFGALSDGLRSSGQDAAGALRTAFLILLVLQAAGYAMLWHPRARPHSTPPT